MASPMALAQKLIKAGAGVLSYVKNATRSQNAFRPSYRPSPDFKTRWMEHDIRAYRTGKSGMFHGKDSQLNKGFNRRATGTPVTRKEIMDYAELRYNRATAVWATGNSGSRRSATASTVISRGMARRELSHGRNWKMKIAGTAIMSGAVIAGVAGGARNSIQNRPMQRGIGAIMHGRGYASWTPGRSGGMSAEHLGASGGLALNMYRSRHRS